MGRRETILKATEWVQIMYPASTGNIYHFLFSDLKPAARVHSVKLMDWIDSQQWLLQLEDESPHHFLSFFSSFFCFPPSVARSFFLKHLPFFPPPHPHARTVPPSSSLLLLCHHRNIWLTYVWVFAPCQLAGICRLTRARSRSPARWLERSGK